MSIFERMEPLNADNEDANQTARMRRLILVFFGRTYQKVRLG